MAARGVVASAVALAPIGFWSARERAFCQRLQGLVDELEHGGRWSPNGRCLVGYSATGIGIVSASGDSEQSFPRPFPWVLGLRFTPDGRHLIFHAASGRNTTEGSAIYTCDLDGSHLRKLIGGTRGAGDPVVISPDGRWIAYPDRRGTLVRSVKGGRSRRLLNRLFVMAWAPAPRH